MSTAVKFKTNAIQTDIDWFIIALKKLEYTFIKRGVKF